MDDPREFLTHVDNIEGMLKKAFAAVPPAGAQAGPPAGGPPMDPAMAAGGAMPPGAMPPGAMPPGGAPPMDPAMAGGAPPAPAPAVDPNSIVTILTGMQGEIDSLKNKVEGIENLRKQREELIAGQTGLVE